MSRLPSALSQGFRPVRTLFAEVHAGGRVVWKCRLCGYEYGETDTRLNGWPMSVTGLLMLVEHTKNHVNS